MVKKLVTAGVLSLASSVTGFQAPLIGAGRPQMASARRSMAPAVMGSWIDEAYEYGTRDGDEGTRDGDKSVMAPPELVAPPPEPVVSPPEPVMPVAVTSPPQPAVVAPQVGTVVPTVPVAPPTRAASMPRMDDIVHEAGDLLSHQAIMENFVHHNPWESLQGMDFYDALESVSKKQEYMSPGERLSSLAPLDPRVRANKAIAELGAPFLDRGLAKWEAPNRERGFLYFFASLEGLGSVPWRSGARDAAKLIMQRYSANPELDSEQLVYAIIEENLSMLEENPAEWEQTTRAMLLDLPGWAGMFKRMQEHPSEGPATCLDGVCQLIDVKLAEFLAVHLILTRSSIEAMAIKEGWEPEFESLSGFLAPIGTKRKGERLIFGMGKEMDSLQNPSGLATPIQNFNMMESLENEYARVTLKSINIMRQKEAGSALDGRPRANFQFYTCFDEREESFRRYIEAAATSPTELETYGVAGFFNMAIRYQAANLRPMEILAPEGVVPPEAHLVVEKQQAYGWAEKKKFQAEVSLAFEKATYSPIGSLVIAGVLLPYSMARLLLRSFSPGLTIDLEDKANELSVGQSKTDFAPPYTAEEATTRLAQLFKNIGAKDNFARLVVVTGHGARQVNNPFLAAYNCGACCGREGGPNARVMARCANDPTVRAMLRAEHGINVPDDTWFVGGYHDTTSDLVDLYDLERVPPGHQADLQRARSILDEARSKNALERCSKFALTDADSPEVALKHVEQRSRDVAEVRPELCHSTNAAIIVGRRELTMAKFFDRRTFLPTYDPFNDDEEGTNLQTVITPALVVGSGINLEYFFSTVDAGAGTKVPVNVVGNFGLQQGTAGDLLIGLATQMSELHSPVRALYLIDAPVARVEKCLGRNKVLLDLVRNNWVKFYVRDPYTQKIYRQEYGEYIEVDGIDGVDTLADNGLKFLNPMPPDQTHVPFVKHTEYIQKVKLEEDVYTAVSAAIMISSAVLPIATGAVADFHQPLIMLGATLLGVSNLAYSRRYLHGEFMYGRMTLVSACMVAGFNMVTAAPGLEDALIGWTLIGFSSTILIGGFNDRPTARDNAAYAFSIYQLSDAALLLAAAFTSTSAEAPMPENAAAIASFGLLVAAGIKSSQFPFSGLFLRSMEGASPNSALGYAGISAHVGIVLLAGTMPIWFQFEWARTLMALTGALTVAQSGIIANVRADRKGGVASAASATLGALFIITSQGYTDLALFLSLGHAAFRMNQVVRSPGVITDAHKWEAALGQDKIASEKVIDVAWKTGWALNRISTDYFRLPDLYANVDLKQPLVFYNAKYTQAVVTAVVLVLIGAFHLPQVDETIGDLMKMNGLAAAGLLSLNIFGSTALVRFLLGNVLDFGRFRTRDRGSDKAV